MPIAIPASSAVQTPLRRMATRLVVDIAPQVSDVADAVPTISVFVCLSDIYRNEDGSPYIETVPEPVRFTDAEFKSVPNALAVLSALQVAIDARASQLP